MNFVTWLKGAFKWLQDNNVLTHAVGFALIGIAIAVFFILVAAGKSIGDCVAAFGAIAGVGSALVTVAHGWSK